VGKRSRKRSGGGTEVAPAPTTRAERDAARRRRAEALDQRRAEGRPARKRRPGRTSFEDRPPAPWGNFPLVELCVLLGIVLLVAGFVVRGERGATMIVGGMALASLAGLELSIREHFAGFRSHTTLLAGAVGFAALALSFWLTHNRVLIIPIGATVFLGAFIVFRQVFIRRSGGVGFRR
jgi:hypothetical protein